MKDYLFILSELMAALTFYAWREIEENTKDLIIEDGERVHLRVSLRMS